MVSIQTMYRSSQWQGQTGEISFSSHLNIFVQGGGGGVGAKWAKIRPILTLMNFSKKQRCPVNVFLPLNMHHEISEQNKIAQFYSDEMSKLR